MAPAQEWQIHEAFHIKKKKKKHCWKKSKRTQIEKYTVFMDQKNQYCENEYTTQSDL